MANFFSNTTGLQYILDTLESKAMPTINTSVCNAFPMAIDQTLTPPAGYYYSQVNVAGDSNLTASNIKSGVTIFGVEGTLTGGSGSNNFETTPDFTYSVNSISGAPYGFSLNSQGYYESQNKEVEDSYAACRVNLTVTKQCTICFDGITDGEVGWDYGVMGVLDKALSAEYDDNEADIHCRFKTLTNNAYKVYYENVPVGTHFIDIKYIKDESYSENSDCFKFKIYESSSLSQDVIDGLIAADEDFKPENIRRGVNVLGVTGTYGTASPNIDAIFNRSVSGTLIDTDLTVVPSGAMCYLDKVTNVSFPRVSEVGAYGMYNSPSLKTVNLPACEYVGSYAFADCTNLSSVNIEYCGQVGDYAFAWTNLKSLNHTVQIMGTYAFGGTSLTSFMGYGNSLPNYAFAYCYSLSQVSFPYLRSIHSSAFAGCYRLSKVYLKSSSVCKLSHSNAFSSTPFAGYSAYFSGTPYIYVPTSLVASYKAAANWSYFSKYISGV